VAGLTCGAHRLAFLYIKGKLPAQVVDHPNHKRADNRWSNLREATPQDNQKNQSLRSDNKSGRIGVNWQKREGSWRAQIKVSGKTIHLGQFTLFEDAVAAREIAEAKHGFHQNHGRKAA